MYENSLKQYLLHGCNIIDATISVTIPSGALDWARIAFAFSPIQRKLKGEKIIHNKGT